MSIDTLSKALRHFARLIFSVVAIMMLLITLMMVPQSVPEAQAQQPPQPAQEETEIGTCGGSIALVFDLSGNTTSGTLAEVKNAARQFVTNLSGAAYDVGVYNYATSSPAYGNNNHAPVSVRDQSGVNQVNARINGLTKPSNQIFQPHRTGSNWEGGLESVLDSGTDYDTVFFFTSGPPNHNNDGNNRILVNDSTEVEEIEAAEDRSNELTATGAEVIPVGVGRGVVGANVGLRDSLLNWTVRETVPVQELLERIATDPSRVLTAVGTGTMTLPARMKDIGVPTCVQVTKNIVDADGTVLRSGEGWTFDATLSDAPGGASLSNDRIKTGTQGRGSALIEGLPTAQTATVTLTERPQEAHQIVPNDGRAARCSITRPGVGEIAVTPEALGDTGVQVDLQGSDALNCTFDNVELVPVALTKTVSASPQALVEQIRQYQFNFDFECRAGDEVVASGSFENVAAEQNVLLAPAVPVGAHCTVTEVIPPNDPILQNLLADWSVTNGTVEDSGAAEFSVDFRVDPAAGGAGNGVTVGIHNSYVAQTGSMTLHKQVERGSLPAAQVPGQFPVRYFCRYVPDPDERPELGGGGTNPGDVASGYVTISETESATIDNLPVGTQCGFEEVAEDGSTPTVPGFSLSTAWASDACLDYRGAGTGLRECQANYIRVPESGSFNLQITNSYQRETGSLRINLDLSGDAADRGQERSYLFDVVCTVEGEQIFSQAGVRVTPSLPTTIPGVPAGADCTVTESGTEVPGVDITHVGAPTGVIIEAAGGIGVADVVLDLSAQEAMIRLSSTHEIDPEITDPATIVELQSAPIPVTAQCWAPGAETPSVWTGTVGPGMPVDIGPYPVGTSCQLREDYDSPVGVEEHATFSPGTVELTSVAGADVALDVHFAVATSSLVLQHSAALTSPVADSAQLRPEHYNYDYTCTDGTNGTWDLTSGQTVWVDVTEGAECTIRLDLSGTDTEALNRTTTWTTPSGSGESSSTTDSGLVTLTGTIPNDQVSATVAVDHRYSPALTPATVSLEAVLQNPDGGAADPAIRDAVLGDQRYLMMYSCTRNGVEVAAASRVLDSGEPRVPELPLGSECTFSLGQEQLVSADGPEVAWNGTGQVSEESFILTPTAAVPPVVAATSNYTVKLGGFNLKKKVDGEGVATIHRDRGYQASYVCTLNDVVVGQGDFTDVGRFDSATDTPVRGIPVGADCVITEDRDSAQEDNAEWSARWTVSPDETGWDAAEQPCASVSGCAPDPELGNQATLTIADRSTVDNQPYFQGTVVVWNTYVYNKVQLEVNNHLTGDGPELAADEESTYTYVCVDPRYEGSELEDEPYIPDPTRTGLLQVTGAGAARELIQDPDDPAGQIAVPSRSIPVGFDCQITQNLSARYDAEVTAHFESHDGTAGEMVDPTWTEATIAVATSPEFADGVQPLNVTNDYQRIRSELLLSSTYDTRPSGTVHQYLDPVGAPAVVQWRCFDPVLNQTYEGTVDTPMDGQPVPVRLPEDAPGTDPRLPASASCEVTGGPDQERIPNGFEDLVVTGTTVNWQDTSADGNLTDRGRGTQPRVENISLLSEGETRIAFANSYVMPQRQIGVANFVVGDDEEQIVTDETVGFRYSYRCELPLLPGQEAPFPETGGFELGRGDAWLQTAPIGTTCDLTLEEPDPEVLAGAAENNLRLQTSYAYSGQSGDPEDIRGESVAPGDTVVIETASEPDAVDRNLLGMFQNFYREDGDVAVQKVNADGSSLPGAAFAVYPATADGGMADEPVIEDMQWDPEVADGSRFITGLVPGQYFLVETRSGDGSELMPRPWQFNVEVDPDSEQWGDIQIRLTGQVVDSGLVTIEEPSEDQPWVIQVANIATGELPLTGDRGIWPGVFLGSSILLLAAAWYAHTKRRRD